MKKEIINLKVYISLLTILYIGLFAYLIITTTELAPEYMIILPPVIFNIIVNFVIFINEEAGIKIVPALAAFTLMMGAVSVNVICLVGAIVLFVGWFKYYKVYIAEKKAKKVYNVEINENQYNNETIPEELPDMVVDGYITKVLFDPNYQGAQPYSIEIEYYLGDHIYTFEVGGFERDITPEIDAKDLRHIPVFLQHGSPDLAQIDEEALRHNLNN